MCKLLPSGGATREFGEEHVEMNVDAAAEKISAAEAAEISPGGTRGQVPRV
jgi:hypothetical protein